MLTSKSIEISCKSSGLTYEDPCWSPRNAPYVVYRHLSCFVRAVVLAVQF